MTGQNCHLLTWEQGWCLVEGCNYEGGDASLCKMRAASVRDTQGVRNRLLGNHIQVIVNGCVQFDQTADHIDCTTILHTSGDGPPCEIVFSARYGHRRPDGTVVS